MSPALWILLLGISLRLLAAASRLDRFWPDEHYQTLEPAFYLIHGYGVLSWEWLEGLRSWSLPALHVPLLGLASLLGFPSGIGASILVRSAYGLADAWVWYRLILWWKGKAATPALAVALLAPTLALWGVSTLQDHLALILFWSVLPTVYDWVSYTGSGPRSGPRSQTLAWFLSGFLLFVIAIPKPQLALLSLGTSLGLLWQNRPHLAWNRIASAAGGALTAGLLAGILDWATVGTFAGTLIEQATRGEKLSRFYGTSPAYDYLNRLPELMGGEVLGLILLALIWAAAVRLHGKSPVVPMDPQPESSKLRAVFPGVVLFVLFHSWVPHKETRFLLPVVPALLLGGFSWAQGKAGQLWVAVSLLAFSVSAVAVLKKPLPYSSVEVGKLEEWIRTDWMNSLELSGKSSVHASGGHPPPQITLCLIGSNWSFLRGSLGLGAPVRTIDTYSEQEFADKRGQFGECHYAIVSQTQLTRFLETSRWSDPLESQNDFVLLKSLSHFEPGKPAQN